MIGYVHDIKKQLSIIIKWRRHKQRKAIVRLLIGDNPYRIFLKHL